MVFGCALALVSAFSVPPCCLLSHPRLLEHHLPACVPDGAGTHRGRGCLISGSEMTPAQGCAWNTSLPREEPLLLHPIHPSGQHRISEGKASQLLTLPGRQHLIPTHKDRGRSSAGSIRHPAGIASHPRLAAERPAVIPDKLQTTAPVLWEMGHSSRAEVFTIPPSKHVPPNQEHLGRMLRPLCPALQGDSRREQSPQPPGSARCCPPPSEGPGGSSPAAGTSLSCSWHAQLRDVGSLAGSGCAHPRVCVTDAVLTLSHAQTNKP